MSDATVPAVRPRLPPSVMALAFVVFLDAMSYALILPLLPFILDDYGAGAMAGGALVASHAACAAFSGPLLGWLSDRFGRKPVIVLSLLGAIGAAVAFAFSRDIVTLFVARALAGAVAGNIGVVQAAVADETPTDRRAAAMTLLTIAWALGFVVGPSLAAAVTMMGGRPAMSAGLVGAVASALSAVFVSLAYRQKTGADAEPASDTATGEPGVIVELVALFGSVALVQTGLVSMTGFWAHHAFGWGAAEVSFLFLWVAATIVVVQALGLPWLLRLAGARDSLTISVLLPPLAIVALLSAPQSRFVLAASAPLLLAGITLAQTLCTTLLSQVAPPARRGALLGLANGVAAIARVGGPTACGFLFARVSPTAPYWLVAGLMTCWTCWLLYRRGVGRTT